MSDNDPAVNIWIDAIDRFSQALREMGETARAFFRAHSPEAHEAIAEELNACVLGARERPELTGDFSAEDMA